MREQVYFSTNYVTLDFEVDTSHGDYGHPVFDDNQLLLASWKVGPNGPVQSHYGGEFDQDRLLEAIEVADFIVAHNAKYELGWLSRCGLNLHNTVVYCTMLGEYVLLGNLARGCDVTNMPPRPTSLDACCRRRNWEIKDPVVDKMMKYGINPVHIPRPWLQGRCEQDVITTERLFREQLGLLSTNNLLPVLYTRCLITPVLAALEFNGMFLDAERVETTYEEYRLRLLELERRMDDITGGINWRSPLQVADFLYDAENGLGFAELSGRDGRPQRTASGRKKADKHTMAALKARNAKQREFLEVRTEMSKISAALSKSLEFFKGTVEENDSLFYAVLNQNRTRTHRLSSTGHTTHFEQFEKPKSVQFQNMARQFKPMFRSRDDDWLMVEVDGSQLEFRVAADLGQDKVAMNDIINPDFDAHVQSASVMNDIPYDDFLERYRGGDKYYKEMRTDAKPDTFKPLYGGESGTKKQKRWYAEFKNRYSGIAARQQEWIEQVLATKQLITPWGLRYHWPRARRDNGGYVNVTRSVCNYPVQAFATAEIIPIALRSLWDRLDGVSGVRFVNTVHDSVILECHPDSLDALREAAIQAFGNDVYAYLKEVYKYDFKVPLGCGITVGTHWSEGAEESYNLWPNGKVEKVA